MDIGSPESEKSFPGLFGSKSSKISSDGSDDETPRKDSLLSGKKDSKKDKGYATLEGENSPDEETEMKSPFKGKKKSFKFAPRKDKKSKEEAKSTLDRKADMLKALKEEEEKEKELKQKEKEAKKAERELKKKQEKTQSKEKIDAGEPKKAEKSEKERVSKKEKPEKKEKSEKKEKAEKKDKKEKSKEKIEKEKAKTDSKDKSAKKEKLKSKEKKKETFDPNNEEVYPVFGVPLSISFQRSRCHDGIEIPFIVRECIDAIEENGLTIEGIYRSSGIKTKVAELRKCYNLRLPSKINEYDMPTVASLLKQYFRELPENLLTAGLENLFEDVALLKDEAEQHRQLRYLIDKLPVVNRLVLSWLFVHMSHVIQNEKLNKMNVQNLCLVLHPTLNFSHRLIAHFISNGSKLFDNVPMKRYVPPLSALGGKTLELPETLEDIEVELKKQESLLAEIHSELSVEVVWKHREEQLWEAQRIVTQLKRKLKMLSKQKDNPDNSTTMSTTPSQADGGEIRSLSSELQEDSSKSIPDIDESTKNVNDPDDEKVELVTEEIDEGSDILEQTVPPESVDAELPVDGTDDEVSEHLPLDDNLTDEEYVQMLLEELRWRIEMEEREKNNAELIKRIKDLNEDIGVLQEQLSEVTALHSSENSDDSGKEDEIDPELEERDQQILADILRENRELEEKNEVILQRIFDERERCIAVRTKIRFEAEKKLVLLL